MPRTPVKTNTAERQLDGVQGNHLSGDCVAHRNGPRRQRARGHARRKQPMRGVELLEEVRFLLPDRSPEDIAAALGYKSPASIARAMHRMGQRELASVFDRAARRQHRMLVAA